MIDISNAQVSRRVLEQWLMANDFRQTHSQQRQVTSDDYAEWISPTLRVEIKVDRRQMFLGIGLRTMATTYHPDEWEAWLDGGALRRHLSGLDHQIAFVTQRWLRAAALAAADISATENAIEAIGLDWIERRFGWRPGRLHEAR